MAHTYAKDQPHGFTNRIEKVAIVGASGQVGRFFVEELMKTGKHAVTAVTRPGRTSGGFAQGVKVVPVDYDDQQSIVTALAGQQVLIITLSLGAPADTQSKLIRAAALAGVPYVMPSWHGVDLSNVDMRKDLPVKQEILKGPEEIEGLGVSSWITFTTGFWYEFSLSLGPDTFGMDVKNRSITWIDNGTTPINVSTWPMCGKAMAGLLSLKELPEDENDASPTLSQFRNRNVFVSSFQITQRDIFESIKNITGTSEQDWTMREETSMNRWRDGIERIKKGDLSGFGRQFYGRVLFPNGGGEFESKQVLLNRLLGLPKEDLDMYTGIGLGAMEGGTFNYPA